MSDNYNIPKELDKYSFIRRSLKLKCRSENE
jgi:hypothetical protein